MTILPNAMHASVAGTQRAVTRSADAQHSQSQAVSRQVRAEHPGGEHSGVEQVEPDTATGDSGADGRQLLQQRDHHGDADEDAEERHEGSRHRAPKAGTGGCLDFDA